MLTGLGMSLCCSLPSLDRPCTYSLSDSPPPCVTAARASHILVPDEAQCLSLKAEIQAGAEFAEVAKKHSTCPSGTFCNGAGSVRHAVALPAVSNAFFSLISISTPLKPPAPFRP